MWIRHKFKMGGEIHALLLFEFRAHAPIPSVMVSMYDDDCYQMSTKATASYFFPWLCSSVSNHKFLGHHAPAPMTQRTGIGAEGPAPGVNK